MDIFVDTVEEFNDKYKELYGHHYSHMTWCDDRGESQEYLLVHWSGDNIFLRANPQNKTVSQNITVKSDISTEYMESIKDQIIDHITDRIQLNNSVNADKIISNVKDIIAQDKEQLEFIDDKEIPETEIVSVNYSHGYKYTLTREEVKNESSRKHERERAGKKRVMGRNERRISRAL